LRKPPLKKHQTHAQAAADAAAVVEQARRELRILQAAPLPIAELKEYASMWVIERARRGAPRVSADRGQLHIQFTDPNSGGRPADDFVAFQCWLDGPAVVKRPQAEIDALNLDDAKSVSGDVRVVKIRELEERILDCEFLEEQHIERAQAEGMFMLRRRNANPMAVLGVIAPRPARWR
jgi:hypothetical protein